MPILNEYLLYLMLTEREWNKDTENPDSFNLKNFEDLIGKKIDLGVFKKMRHHLQPSLYNIYIKNALGDYEGRPDMMNSQTLKHIGFDQFKKDLDLLKKRAEFAQKIKEKTPSNFFKHTARHGETGEPGDNLSSGDGGGDGGGGGE